jgi:hypothetical protein
MHDLQKKDNGEWSKLYEGRWQEHDLEHVHTICHALYMLKPPATKGCMVFVLFGSIMAIPAPCNSKPPDGPGSAASNESESAFLLADDTWNLILLRGGGASSNGAVAILETGMSELEYK